MDHSANVTTSHAIAKMANSALVMACASATVAAVMKAGAEVHANAAHLLTSVPMRRAKSVRVMEIAFAESASARKTRTADTQESFVRSAQHAPTVALS